MPFFADFPLSRVHYYGVRVYPFSAVTSVNQFSFNPLLLIPSASSLSSTIPPSIFARFPHHSLSTLLPFNSTTIVFLFTGVTKREPA